MFLVLLFSRRGRDPIVVLGFILSMLAYFLTFLAIPNSANLNETEELAFIDPNRFLVIVLNLKFDPFFRYLIIFIAFLLGFSDACFNTQVRFRSLSHVKDKKHKFKFSRSHQYSAECSRSNHLQLLPSSSSCSP